MKKIFNAVLIVFIILLTVPIFAAFESFVLNVSATVDDALTIDAPLIEFGTVFPQEQIDKFIKIGLSASFQNEITADEVSYMIRQKPKCGQVVAGTQPVVYSAFAQSSEDAGGNFICPEGFVKLPTLCPYLSKIDVDTLDQNDDPGISAFHGSINNWNASTTINTQVNGMLSKSTQDLEDAWKIDLKVPCFKDECAQDWNNFVTTINPDANPADYIQPQANKKQMLGCDIWIEVTKINGGKTMCGDGIKQTPNEMGTGGPNNDGNEDCDVADGVTAGFTCTNNCVLQPIAQCTPGQTRTCETGLLGICAAGTQTCVDPGNWGSCVQNQQPINEICTNGVDDDCDSEVDEDLYRPCLDACGWGTQACQPVRMGIDSYAGINPIVNTF